MLPQYIYYVRVFTKGLPASVRAGVGRMKGGTFIRKDEAVEFYNKRKAAGATCRFYVAELGAWQELDHASTPELN